MSDDLALDSDLSARRARILALVVREHVRDAQPVASGTLVRNYDLGCSAATVRSELAFLEEAGLLAQPHTSAGRVPTVKGYRYFVERLMSRAGLPEPERRTIRHQFHQAGAEPERWLRLSAAVIARVSGLAGLVALPRDGGAPLHRLEILRLDDGLVQMLALLGDGSVRQARWRPRRTVEQDELDRLAMRLNADLQDGTIDATKDIGRLEADVRSVLGELTQPGSDATAPQLFHAGLSQILDEPEFADSGRLRGVVEILEHGQLLEALAPRLPRDGVEVFIGGEPPLEDLPYLTLVFSRFGPARRPEGMLGVVGPRRLAYERAVPTVRYVARLMSRLMAGEVA